MNYLLSQHHIDRLLAYQQAITENQLPVKLVLREDETHGHIIGVYRIDDSDNYEFLLWRFNQPIGEFIKVLKALNC